jgi:hypothetical protein
MGVDKVFDPSLAADTIAIAAISDLGFEILN